MLQKEEQEFRASDIDLTEESFEGKRELLIAKCPFSRSMATKTPVFVPLFINRSGVGPSGHRPSEGTIAIMKNISLSDLQKMTDIFYEKAFLDTTLDKFIGSHEDPHGERFAKWIHQKLSGSTVWDQDRASRQNKSESEHFVHDRTSAHVAAWHSPKRPPSERGRRFKLDECRVWMRLHFWAMRESGMMDLSPSFCDYYVRFIAHFMRVYENTAPAFARESFRWSGSARNIDEYIHRHDRKMKDVLGLDFQSAISQLPASELNDFEWPYNQTPKTFRTTSSDEEVSW